MVFSLTACREPTQTEKREQLSGQIIHEFAKSMKKKGLYAVGSGGGERNDITKEISVTLSIDKLMDIALARSFLVDAVDEILTITNRKENISQFFDKFPVPSSVFNIAIIGQGTEKGDFDHIETVYIYKGTVCYCANDPDPRYNSYKCVLKETFEEAKRNLTHK